MLKQTCIEIEKRYEINFLEIGVDKDHVHFLVQSSPMYSPKKIVQTIKSITAREEFKSFPSLKKELWGTEFWTKGYFISTVGRHGDERQLSNYVKNQGIKDYKQIHSGQLKLL
jgi:REP element-mobilizing transposase RayT